MTNKNENTSRSSSGSGEAVHGEDVAHACAHAHGMGQEDGFRAGVEAAAREVASWAADAAHFNGRERKALGFAAKQIRALSSAPPSHDSGERLTPLDDAETTEAMLEAEVRALEEALREAVTLLSGPLTVLHRVHTPSFWICTCEAEADSDYPTGKPCSCPRPEMKIGCVENCPACAAKRARDAFVERARALSPQGDGGTER